MTPQAWPVPRARFCRRCGAMMRIVTVSIKATYDPQTGKRGSDQQRRWDCPDGIYAMGVGHEGGHSSPDMEVLD